MVGDRVVQVAARQVCLTLALALTGCGGEPVRAFLGARLIDGTGARPVEDAALVVRAGRIIGVGARSDVEVPRGAEVIDLSGRTVIPGLINAHGHVGDTRGLQTGQYSAQNVEAQLRLYARYGVTTVVALGGDQAAALPLRARRDSATLDHARLYIAGTVVSGQSADEVRGMIDHNAALRPDLVKIRVDDNLGTAQKMPPEAFQAAIEHAHRGGWRVAAHVYYLADAKELVRAGVDFLAHSVRDRAVDAELIALMTERGVCYCPTLMREVSTYVYQSAPAFFQDPFFTAEADPRVVSELQDPARQARIRTDRAAQTYRRGLPLAKRNLKRLMDAGVKVAMGTDTGPPARFQGYFEHLELEQMVDAGLTPMQSLVAATGDAAQCFGPRLVLVTGDPDVGVLPGLTDLGTLEEGKWADFVVLAADPLVDIRSTRSIQSVWIAGNQVSSRGDTHE